MRMHDIPVLFLFFSIFFKFIYLKPYLLRLVVFLVLQTGIVRIK